MAFLMSLMSSLVVVRCPLSVLFFAVVWELFMCSAWSLREWDSSERVVWLVFNVSEVLVMD